MKEVGCDSYTGFSSCRYIEEFEKDLKLKRISRRTAITNDVEVILRPREYAKRMEELREALKSTIKDKMF